MVDRMLLPSTEREQVYIPYYTVLGNLPSASRHVCWDGKKFNGFTEWQHSLYHPSLRVTQAYDVSVTLFMPLAAEHTFHHCSTSPSLVLPVYDDFLLRGAALLALFKQMQSAVLMFYKVEGVPCQPYVMRRMRITLLLVTDNGDSTML